MWPKQGPVQNITGTDFDAPVGVLAWIPVACGYKAETRNGAITNTDNRIRRTGFSLIISQLHPLAEVPDEPEHACSTHCERPPRERNPWNWRFATALPPPSGCQSAQELQHRIP